MLAEIHFIRPGWLLLFIPFAIIFGFMLHRKLSSGNWQSVCDRSLLPYILSSTETRQNQWPIVWFVIAGILAILAMAGPTWQRLPSPVFRSQSATVIILDLSRSMDAQDIKPSRLQRARFKIKDVLDRQKDGQTALIVYAGDAFTVTPLTDDVETIGNHLSGLDTSLMPVQGSNTSRALEEAELLFKQAGITSGHILLVSDGADSKKVGHAVRRLASEGYRLSVLAIGTSAGAPIPQRQGGFLKDSAGNIVVSKLDSVSLQELAEIGDGVFQLLTTDSRDVETIDRYVNQRLLNQSKQKSDLTIDQWEEVGPWLLLPVLFIGALVFRKGIVAVVVLPILSVPWESTHAVEWKDLWETPDQQASRAYRQGDAEKAAGLFKSRKWKGAAQYSSGDYESAIETLEGLEDSNSFYNKGNALARSGRYQQALEAYEESLKQDSNNEDAKYNKKIVEEELRQQQQNQQQSTSDQNSDQKNDSSQESQDQNSANSNDSQSEQQNNEENQQKSSTQHSKNAESDTRDDSKDFENQKDSESAHQDNQLSQAETQANNDDKSTVDQQPQQFQPQQSEENQTDESKQATEQWLRRIPDDPGRLLREKFRYQYRQRNRAGSGTAEQW